MFNKFKKILNSKLQTTFSLIFLIITIDQLIKLKIRTGGEFYFCNKNISFNFQVLNQLLWLLLLLFLSFSTFYCLKLFRKVPLPLYFFLGLGFFWGGILANFLDRFFFGCVFDYLFLPLITFPLFNLADIAISTGAFFLLFYFLKSPE